MATGGLFPKAMRRGAASCFRFYASTRAGLYPTLLAGGRYHVEPPSALGLENPFQPDLGRLVETIGASGAIS